MRPPDRPVLPVDCKTPRRLPSIPALRRPVVYQLLLAELQRLPQRRGADVCPVGRESESPFRVEGAVRIGDDIDITSAADGDDPFVRVFLVAVRDGDEADILVCVGEVAEGLEGFLCDCT